MYPINGNALVGLDDGLYGGMLVAKGSGDTNIVVQAGLAIIGGQRFERKAADAAVDIAVSATPGKYQVFLNAEGAKDAAGVVLDRLTVAKAEADVERRAINGSVSVREGRSLLLAEVTVGSDGKVAADAIDNTVRLKAGFGPTRRTRRVANQ